MSREPGARIFGVETEFGCLVSSEESYPEMAVEMIKDYVFEDMKLGLIDIQSRDDVFEPAGSGGFLVNGARLYVDAVGSHLEFATAECQGLKDLIANDRAGQRQIVRAITELGLEDDVSIYSNSVDHFGGHTFGCHENYLVKMEEHFFSTGAPLLYPFLVTRQIFAGVGRVGGHMLIRGVGPTLAEMQANPVDYIWVSDVYSAFPDETVKFQLSQRADHILKTVAGRVRFNRALINPKWEHYYSFDGMQRLHILFGEQNQNQYAYALKVGTTHLVLRLVEDELLDHGMDLANPLRALREVSRDETYKWICSRADGETISAIDIQRHYLALAQRYKGESDQTDWILKEWESTLDGLEKDPMTMGDRLDWVAKRKIVEMYMEDGGLSWDDDALHSIDLEYHNIDESKSLFGAWKQMNGVREVATELDIIDAMTEPPQNTRAKGRALAISELLKHPELRSYVFDWSGMSLDRQSYVDLSDPFETYC